jgi:hypothetical protein
LIYNKLDKEKYFPADDKSKDERKGKDHKSRLKEPYKEKFVQRIASFEKNKDEINATIWTKEF